MQPESTIRAKLDAYQKALADARNQRLPACPACRHSPQKENHTAMIAILNWVLSEPETKAEAPNA